MSSEDLSNSFEIIHHSELCDRSLSNAIEEYLKGKPTEDEFKIIYRYVQHFLQSDTTRKSADENVLINTLVMDSRQPYSKRNLDSLIDRSINLNIEII